MTRLQLRNLQIYLKYREQPMTIGGLFWANRRLYLLLLLMFGVATAAFYNLGGWPLAGYMIAALIFILARDIGYFRRSAKIWPVVREVLDWEKVEKLVAAETAGKK